LKTLDYMREPNTKMNGYNHKYFDKNIKKYHIQNIITRIKDLCRSTQKFDRDIVCFITIVI